PRGEGSQRALSPLTRGIQARGREWSDGKRPKEKTPMPRLISRTATTVAALGALALGGSAIAAAATSSNSNSTSTSSSQGSPATAPAGKPAGRHVGANGKQEQALDAATGAKVKAAA